MSILGSLGKVLRGGEKVVFDAKIGAQVIEGTAKEAKVVDSVLHSAGRAASTAEHATGTTRRTVMGDAERSARHKARAAEAWARKTEKETTAAKPRDYLPVPVSKKSTLPAMRGSKRTVVDEKKARTLNNLWKGSKRQKMLVAGVGVGVASAVMSRRAPGSRQGSPNSRYSTGMYGY